jgi:hypothetical protein
MRILKRIRNGAIAITALSVLGVIAYQVLLDDVAKQGISSMNRTIIDSYVQLHTLVNDHIGTIMDEETVRQNREQVRKAWENLGF